MEWVLLSVLLPELDDVVDEVGVGVSDIVLLLVMLPDIVLLDEYDKLDV
jgi:hypothetical protein